MPPIASGAWKAPLLMLGTGVTPYTSLTILRLPTRRITPRRSNDVSCFVIMLLLAHGFGVR